MRSIVTSVDVDRIQAAPLAAVDPRAVATPAPKPDPAAPFMAGRMPKYGTLLYLEKLGLVVLTVAALLYLLTRTAQGGPGVGLKAAASIRGVG